jgi:hypothetical protein
MLQKYVLLSGATSVSNSTTTNSIIAGQAGKTFFITAIILTVTTASSGGTGIVSIQNGSNTIIQFSAAAVMSMQVNLGDQIGYPLSSGNALTLTVSGATTQATAYASAVGYIAG